jgi:hypothetical protein
MNACSVCRNEQTCCFSTYLFLFNVFNFLLSFLNLENSSTSKLSERDVNALAYVWVCFVLFSTTSPFVAFHIILQATRVFTLCPIDNIWKAYCQNILILVRQGFLKMHMLYFEQQSPNSIACQNFLHPSFHIFEFWYINFNGLSILNVQ